MQKAACSTGRISATWTVDGAESLAASFRCAARSAATCSKPSMTMSKSGLTGSTCLRRTCCHSLSMAVL